MRVLLAMESTVTRVVFERRLRAIHEGPQLLIESVTHEQALAAARAETVDLVVVDSPIVGEPPLDQLSQLRSASPTLALAVATWRPHHLLDKHAAELGYTLMMSPFPEDEIGILVQRAQALHDRWADRELRFAS